jgi:hypothetical protein
MIRAMVTDEDGKSFCMFFFVFLINVIQMLYNVFEFKLLNESPKKGFFIVTNM